MNWSKEDYQHYIKILKDKIEVLENRTRMTDYKIVYSSSPEGLVDKVKEELRWQSSQLKN